MSYALRRRLGDDPAGAAFNLYKDGAKLNAKPLKGATDFVDKTSGSGAYTVRLVAKGKEGAASKPVQVWTDGYLSIPIEPPPGGVTRAGETYEYTANDASVGDLDGDGRYEIVLKWDPTNSKDNAFGGYTGCISVSRTVLNFSAGGRGRLSGLTAAAISASMLLFAPLLLGYMPKFVLGGLLIYLGADTLHRWIVQSRRRLSLTEYLSLLAIIVIILQWGFVAGILFRVHPVAVVDAFGILGVRNQDRFRPVRRQRNLELGLAWFEDRQFRFRSVHLEVSLGHEHAEPEPGIGKASCADSGEGFRELPQVFAGSAGAEAGHGDLNAPVPHSAAHAERVSRTRHAQRRRQQVHQRALPLDGVEGDRGHLGGGFDGDPDAAAGRHTFPAVIGLEASWVLAERMVRDAIAAVEPIEGKGGPLALLARYILERNS